MFCFFTKETRTMLVGRLIYLVTYDFELLRCDMTLILCFLYATFLLKPLLGTRN